MAKGKSGGMSGRSKLRLLLFVLLVLLPLGASFVPSRLVPEAARPFHNQLLAWRNRAADRSGVPLKSYEPSAVHDLEGGNVAIYFAPSREIEGHLANFIASAKTSVAVCIYDLDLSAVIQAMVDAKARGVDLRLVMDTDNVGLAQLEPLRRAGVTIVGDERSAIMHDKFVVVDGEKVWTGSFNFTRNGADKNDNNAIVIHSPVLAANYLAEFDEMYVQRSFGIKSPKNTPNPKVRLGDMEVENYFAPEDGVMREIVSEVGSAENSIDVMAFSFTSSELSEAIWDRMRSKGVAVRVLFDDNQSRNKYSQDEWLDLKGAKVRISPNRRGVMHHKVIIIDGHTVVTGSFNFSKNADKSNDENVLIIHSPSVAGSYAQEFERCWGGTKGY